MVKKLYLFIFVIAILVVFSVTDVFAQEVIKLCEDTTYIEKKISEINKQKQAEQERLNNIQKQKEAITASQNKTELAYKELLEDVDQISKELSKFDEQLTKAESTYNTNLELFKTRIKVMYENSFSAHLESLVETKNLSDLRAKLEYISLMNKKDKELLDNLEASKKELEYKRDLVLAKKKDVQEKTEETKNKLNEVYVDKSNITAKLEETNARLKKLEEDEDNLLRQAEALKNQIKQNSGSGSYSGSMTWPCPASSNITSPFGNRYHPVLKTYKMHTGIDIAAPAGSSIIAANKGKVIISEYQSGYGNLVAIDHGGGITTAYAHCSERLVSVGQYVEKGALIARVGSTGLSTGPHLHFEVRVNGEYVNPLNYVSP